MKRCRILLIATLLFAVLKAEAFSAESQWVKTGTTGRLIYVPDASGDRITDFSNVGYKGRGSQRSAVPTSAICQGST